MGGQGSWAIGVSKDGSVIVGSIVEAVSIEHPYRWTQSGGVQDLGAMGGKWARANGVSADGSVIVGNFAGAKFGQHAFRWTQSGGPQDLGTNFGQRGVDQPRL
jgi:probable HAF family extracellular repeat protein